MKTKVKMTRIVTTAEDVELVIDNDKFQYIMDSHGILLSDLDADSVQYALDAEGHEFDVVRSTTKEVVWGSMSLQGVND